jgi:hypothetical protein
LRGATALGHLIRKRRKKKKKNEKEKGKGKRKTQPFQHADTRNVIFLFFFRKKKISEKKIKKS